MQGAEIIRLPDVRSLVFSGIATEGLLGIRNWLSRKTQATSECENSGSIDRRFSLDPIYRFDLQRTAQLKKLFEVSPEKRDEAWSEQFFDAAWTAAMVIPQEPVFIGPDGFPYLRLSIPEDGGDFEANSLCNVASSLVEQGIGAAFFASPEDSLDNAQYVLSMGVLSSLLRFDSFRGDPLDVEEMHRNPDARPPSGHQTIVSKGEQIMIGAPSNQYLSEAEARALDRHLKEGWKMDEPRVALMLAKSMTPSRTLVINKSADDFRREAIDDPTRDARVQMLAWYLPPLRSITLKTDAFDYDTMVPLSSLY